MTQAQHRKMLVNAIVLLLILSCGIPAGGSQSAAPENISTIIAGTAMSASTQTAAASGLAAPAPTPTATAIQLATAAGPVFSLYDTALVTQADGSTLLIDRKGGYQITVPAGWLAVRVNEQEYYAAFASNAAADPVIRERLTDIQNANLDHLRLDAIDIRPGHTPNQVITVLSIILEDRSLSLEEWDQAEKDNPLPFDNFTEVGSSFQQASDGSRILVRERTWDSSQAGEVVYYRGTFLSLTAGTLVVDLQSNLTMKDVIMAEYEQVINSLTLLTR